MRRRIAGLLLAALPLVAGCSGIGGTGNLNYVSGDGKVVEIGPDNRDAAVEVSGTTVQGEPLDLADDRGKVVVVNFWWSGCGPCIKEMPMLVDTEKSYASGAHKGDVAFVGINIRDLAPENAAAFERARGVDYPSLYDPGSKTLFGFGKYAPNSTPATLVLDREGRVAAVMNGPIPSQSTLTSVVDELLGESDG